MESELEREFLSKGFSTVPDGANLITPDGKDAYAVKFGGRGVRDLRSAVFGLAMFLSQNPKVRRGHALTSLIRISSKRVTTEWERIQRVLLPDLAARIHLAAIVHGTDVVEMPRAERTPVIARFIEMAKKPSGGRNRSTPAPDPAVGMTWKHLEVEKVLLHRWLLGEGAIPIGTLCRQVGCSYPTATQTIGRLSANDLIVRGRGRSVGLAKYPRDRWAELLRAQRLVYPPMEFAGSINEPGAVDSIVRRLNRLRPSGAAMGGVIAARRWDPSFDLNGTPRVDVVLQTPAGRSAADDDWIRVASEFVRRIDPALKAKSPQVNGATVLVLHAMYRKEPLFLEEPQATMPWADPVEVICHLNELGLTAQAGQMLQRLRAGNQTHE